MKKFFTIITLALCVLLSFTACQQDKTEEVVQRFIDYKKTFFTFYSVYDCFPLKENVSYDLAKAEDYDKFIDLNKITELVVNFEKESLGSDASDTTISVSNIKISEPKGTIISTFEEDTNKKLEKGTVVLNGVSLTIEYNVEITSNDPTFETIKRDNQTLEFSLSYDFSFNYSYTKDILNETISNFSYNNIRYKDFTYTASESDISGTYDGIEVNKKLLNSLKNW